MPTDPFVAPTLDDEPRQEPNLAPGVHLPAARGWRAGRPGDLRAGQPEGPLLGSPGPNVGYACALTERVRDRLVLAPHEHRADAVAIVAEIAMKRSASYGRAPVMADVDAAMLVLGYDGGADPDFAAWRALAVRDASHDYAPRRALVDAVPLDELRLVPAALAGRAARVREQVRDTVGG